MSIVDGTGAVVAEYEYDPYGNIISATGELAEVNPLRYRGYVYDQECNLYYLQSRYYDPKIGRFINADAFASTGQGILGHNMFAYCGNNPIIRRDPMGHWAIPTWEDILDWAKEALDTVVHTAHKTWNPASYYVYKSLHYCRNTLNNVPTTEQKAIQSNYTIVGESDDKFHQNNQRGGRNRKYLSPDGHSEAVYYSNGQLNNTPEDQGTYNVFSSNGNVFERYLGHGLADVLPYMLWGNSPDDETTIVDRIIMTFK